MRRLYVRKYDVCNYGFFYLQDAAKRQTDGIKFTHKPKISIFGPQGRLVAAIQVKIGRTKEHVCPLGRTKFHANRFTGWEHGPGHIRNVHFLVNSCRFLNFFYGVLNNQLFYISLSNLT